MRPSLSEAHIVRRPHTVATVHGATIHGGLGASMSSSTFGATTSTLGTSAATTMAATSSTTMRAPKDRVRDYRQRDLSASHNRRLARRGETAVPKRRPPPPAATAPALPHGLGDACNTGFVHYRMETPAEFAMHKVWLEKRAMEARHQRTEGEVRWALDRWAGDRATENGQNPRTARVR